jgi:3-hydroxyacyl-[acyl-carrier-protein] dehydratase
MAQPLFDISELDGDNPLVDIAGIEAVNPHRGHMRMLDGILKVDPETYEMAAFKDVRADEFWVAGHFPERALFPGVLMVEAAAQLASYVMMTVYGHQLVGFAGIDKVKFRAPVVPGDRLYILGQQQDMRPRRCISQMQGIVNGKICFEAKVTGMPI